MPIIIKVCFRFTSVQVKGYYFGNPVSGSLNCCISGFDVDSLTPPDIPNVKAVVTAAMIPHVVAIFDVVSNANKLTASDPVTILI